jgi:hypothetical protein
MGCGGSTPEADGKDGVGIRDVVKKISGPLAPGVYSHNGGGCVAFCGDSTAVCVGGLGLSTVDVTDKAAPKVLASISHLELRQKAEDKGVKQRRSSVTSDGGAFVRVRGSHAFVTGGHGLAVVDVSTPSQPKKLVNVDTGVLAHNSPGHVFVDKQYAYVVGGLGMRIFDVSDPANPTPVGDKVDTSVGIQTGGGSVLVADGLAFITGGQGFAIFDVRNPAKPTKVSTLTNTGVLSVEDSGCVALITGTQYAYICGAHGMCCVDIGIPAAPFKVGNTIITDVLSPDGGSPCSLQYDLERKLLFVSGGLGLIVFDLYSPTAPKKACNIVTTGVYTQYGGGFNLLTPSGKFLVTAGGLGMAIFKLLVNVVEYEH